MADIVKLSDDDLAWFGETGSHADIAAKWLGLRSSSSSPAEPRARPATKHQPISAASRTSDGR